MVACPSLINPQCPEYTGGSSGGGGGGGNPGNGGGSGSNGGGSSTQKASKVSDGCKDWGFLSSTCRNVGEVFYGAVSNVPHAVEYAGWIWDGDCWDGGPGTDGCDYGNDFDVWVAKHGYDVYGDEYQVSSALAAIFGHNELRKGLSSPSRRAAFNSSQSANKHYAKHVLGVQVGKKGKLTAIEGGGNMPEFQGAGGRARYIEAAQDFMSGAGSKGSISMPSSSGGMFRVDPKTGYFGYMNSSGTISTFFRPKDMDPVDYFWSQFK